MTSFSGVFFPQSLPQIPLIYNVPWDADCSATLSLQDHIFPVTPTHLSRASWKVLVQPVFQLWNRLVVKLNPSLLLFWILNKEAVIPLRTSSDFCLHSGDYLPWAPSRSQQAELDTTYKIGGVLSHVSHVSSLCFFVTFRVCPMSDSTHSFYNQWCVFVCVCLPVLKIWMSRNKQTLLRKESASAFRTYKVFTFNNKNMGEVRVLFWQVEKHPYFWSLIVMCTVHSLPLGVPWFPKYQNWNEIQNCIILSLA